MDYSKSNKLFRVICTSNHVIMVTLTEWIMRGYYISWHDSIHMAMISFFSTCVSKQLPAAYLCVVFIYLMFTWDLDLGKQMWMVLFHELLILYGLKRRNVLKYLNILITLMFHFMDKLSNIAVTKFYVTVNAYTAVLKYLCCKW